MSSANPQLTGNGLEGLQGLQGQLQNRLSQVPNVQMPGIPQGNAFQEAATVYPVNLPQRNAAAQQMAGFTPDWHTAMNDFAGIYGTPVNGGRYGSEWRTPATRGFHNNTAELMNAVMNSPIQGSEQFTPPQPVQTQQHMNMPNAEAMPTQQWTNNTGMAPDMSGRMRGDL